MVDAIGQIAGLATVALPAALLAWALFGIRGTRLSRRVISGLLLAGGAFIGLAVTALSIFFRDGLGPGMVISEGAEAVRRVLPDIIVGWLVATPLLVAGWGVAHEGLLRRSRDAHEQSQ